MRGSDGVVPDGYVSQCVGDADDKHHVFSVVAVCGGDVSIISANVDDGTCACGRTAFRYAVGCRCYCITIIFCFCSRARIIFQRGQHQSTSFGRVTRLHCALTCTQLTITTLSHVRSQQFSRPGSRLHVTHVVWLDSVPSRGTHGNYRPRVLRVLNIVPGGPYSAGTVLGHF